MRYRTFFDMKLFASLLIGALSVVMIGMAAHHEPIPYAGQPVVLNQADFTVASTGR
jgi:hypothetical protein